MQKNDDVIAIYSRKSKYTGKGESIGNQIELCKEYIRLHYSKEEAERAVVYEDEGYSGRDMNRPAYKRMMSEAKKHKYKAIVVYRLDRISRNIGDFAGLVEDLKYLEMDFVSIREQFDTRSPVGRAMMYMSSVFSQLERETIAERIRDNMHELAKTGRWLGGITPTGYASESVQSITVDGKSKKAYKLRLIPKEAEIVKTIFDLYLETDSLTMTEAELMRRGILSKNGRQFTRFSIKGILQNPVYMLADQKAYNYFEEHDAELFSDLSEFDGEHGILTYNRTDQEKGRTTIYLPIDEWIVTVGQHPGLIPGKQWVRVQESLERNKSKSYRKARNNEALLTGLLFCSCGSRMYPKQTQRKNAEGKYVYSYVCKMKERSQRSICDGKNANGNLLDKMMIEEIKKLEDDEGSFIAQLEKSRKFYTGNRAEYEERLADMHQEKDAIEKKIAALVDSLADLDVGSAKGHVTKRIEELNREYEAIKERIQELEGLTSQHALSDIEFDILRQLLTVFKNGIDEMSVEEKRAAIRTVVRRVIWDGRNAHIVLFGADEEEVELPDLSARIIKVREEEEDASSENGLYDDCNENAIEQENTGNSSLECSYIARLGEDRK